MYISVSAAQELKLIAITWNGILSGLITQTNISILKYMLYIAMIDIIDDEQFTFVFEFFQCETKEEINA
jgi:ferritin